MYFYSFVMQNPDGVDWSAEFAHKGRIADDEFQSLCERALLAFCGGLRRSSMAAAFRSDEARGFLVQFMEKEFGFSRLEHSSVYGFDPFDGTLVVSDELRKLVFG